MKKSLVILSVFAVSISYGQKPTGNPFFSTENEKSDWIEKNPEKYNQLNDVKKVKEMEFSSKAEKEAFHADPVRERVVVSDDPSFPTYITTGNKQADNETYAAKKAQWIEQNPAKYEKMSPAQETKNAEEIRAKERKEFKNQKN
jgi:hypothetical protein